MQSLGPTLALKRSAKAGELGPRLATDVTTWHDPIPWYDAMRAQGELYAGKVVHATASHTVSSEVLRSPVFKVGFTPESLPPIARGLVRLAFDDRYPGPAEPPSMLAVDPPQHTKYRRLVSKVFTARAVAALEPRVEQIADELLDEMAKHDTLDLVKYYAEPLPVRIIAEILGIPPHMHAQLVEWGNAAAVTFDPALTYRSVQARRGRAARDAPVARPAPQRAAPQPGRRPDVKARDAHGRGRLRSTRSSSARSRCW